MNFEELLALPYEDLIVELYKNAPQDNTIIKWLCEKYSQKQLVSIYIKLLKQLEEFLPQEKDNDSLPEADELRDGMDAIWYAMDRETIEQCEKELTNGTAQ